MSRVYKIINRCQFDGIYFSACTGAERQEYFDTLTECKCHIIIPLLVEYFKLKDAPPKGLGFYDMESQDKIMEHIEKLITTSETPLGKYY